MRGEYIIGTMLGYSETPWTNDPTKFNRKIGIMTRQYEDQFGQVQSETVTVDVSYENAASIAQLAEKLKGKEVIVPCITMAKPGGKNGAWLSRFMPKDGAIQLFNAPAQRAAG